MTLTGSPLGNRTFPACRGSRPVAGLVLLIVFLLSIPAQFALADARVIDLRIGEQRLTAEVADTDETRRHGLMFRESLPEDHGMLFVWEEPARYAMWMQNTPLPLSVAFIDADGRIINIEDMQPDTTRTHQAAAPVIYALEMEQGWFAARGIRAGDRVSGLPE
ncbi:DUF192 domain-containing protein [Thioalkalivibrio thiocyanodenitrificans]|uniref:DUF192 domain-containing protein n=1 Tax=Thioalkalivibrio thiocyanodenitrificans TaxID=243063 RepID=UPI0003696283|nr:DUF192 domain-containing protein [Thioalkalivibrio thiocyanodenitrificans]